MEMVVDSASGFPSRSELGLFHDSNSKENSSGAGDYLGMSHASRLGFRHHTVLTHTSCGVVSLMETPKKIGIYGLGVGGAGRKGVFMAARLASRYEVTIILDAQHSAADLERYFGVDLRGVKLHPVRQGFHDAVSRALQPVLKSGRRSGHLDALLADLRRDLDFTYFQRIQKLGLDLFINNKFGSNLLCPAPRGIFMCMFPHPMRGQPRPDYGVLHSLYAAAMSRISSLTPQVLDSYTQITANSVFTAEWIGKLWNRQATVVYSASPDMGPPATKEKIIVHVGRIGARSRADYKHQGTLLEAFREMPELHSAGWQLHFAGSVLPEEASQSEFSRLRESAANLAVWFHPNLDFDSLRDLYRRAAIYWHATGYGVPVDEKPFCHEHFGMTTVEAMSAGAVPVVIDSGGQKEIVDHGLDGFRWDSLRQLREFTLRLAADPSLLEEFSRRAVSSSRRFSSEAFGERLDQMVGSLLERGPGG
jgi:glycosyltransferase involved in cell wall biosynthesis